VGQNEEHIAEGTQNNNTLQAQGCESRSDPHAQPRVGSHHENANVLEGSAVPSDKYCIPEWGFLTIGQNGLQTPLPNGVLHDEPKVGRGLNRIFATFHLLLAAQQRTKALFEITNVTRACLFILTTTKIAACLLV
jgi:hypothetical protein